MTFKITEIFVLIVVQEEPERKQDNLQCKAQQTYPTLKLEYYGLCLK